MLKFLLVPVAALLVAAAPAAEQADPLAAGRVQGHVQFLASDMLEGRDTGSRGHALAAEYVVSQLVALGLKPGGPNGSWYQQVPFRRATHAAPAAISIVQRGRRIPLAIGTDAAVRPSLTEPTRSIEAGLVFVGRGINDPVLGIDDYAGIDASGKIVVVVGGTPSGIPSDVASHLRSSVDETAARMGAVGLIELSEARRGSRNVASFAARPVLDWVDADGRTGSSGLLRAMVAISPAQAEKLFAGAPMSLSRARAEIRRRGKVRAFDLPARMAIESRSAWQEFTSPEVVGVLAGSDPRLAHEHVILMGHLDHLGVRPDAKPGEDAIFNGALDNAAGIATMIEAARQFVRSGRPPRRSVMFIANTAEEKGLLGADYFAAHPTVPLRDIVGLVNLDMPLLTYEFSDVIAFGAEHSTIARAVADAGKSMGVSVSPDPMPEQTLFVRSDHYRFVQRGVPAVFLMTGYANGGKKAWEHFLGKMYHRPGDDLSQAIDWKAGARFADLNYRIARALADGEQQPMWYRGDYFGNRFAAGAPKAERLP